MWFFRCILWRKFRFAKGFGNAKSPNFTEKGSFCKAKATIFMKFINVGYGNLVAAERIVMLASPESAPVKRLIQDAKEDGRAIDLTCGKKTKSVIMTDTESVILSALPPEKLATRAEGGEDSESADSIDA